MTPAELDAYLARIGHAGPRAPTEDTLRALHALHPAAIPFEAVDVLLGRGVDIAPGAVQAKLVAGRRGGYCFEQNGLFGRVLAALGFEVQGLLARVRWNVPAGAPPLPRTHMALRVTVEGTPFLADVGFGGCVPVAPLRLDTTVPQPTALETFRLVPAGPDTLVQVETEAGWATMYELFAEPQAPQDYDPPNWYTATHPGSVFRRALMASRVTPAGRASLLDARLTLRRPDGAVERRLLDADGLEAALRDVFGLPVEPAWRPAIEEAAARTAAA